MDKWACEFLARLDRAGVTVSAFMKYVDNVNVVLQMLTPGTRWRGGRLEFSETWEVEDMTSGKSRERTHDGPGQECG